MNDWNPGDKLACVENTCPVCTRGSPNTRGLSGVIVGQVYTLDGFSEISCPQGPGVFISGINNADALGRVVGYCRGRFRKIRPDEHEACEPEFVTLLKRAKEPVHA